MTPRKAFVTSLVVVHIAIGLCAILPVSSWYQRRTDEVAQQRQFYQEGQERRVEQERSLQVSTDQLEALRDENPYVVELIARDRHGYSGSDEITPPPVQSVGK